MDLKKYRVIYWNIPQLGPNFEHIAAWKLICGITVWLVFDIPFYLVPSCEAWHEDEKLYADNSMTLNAVSITYQSS